MTKIALICGVSGQDGAYLAQLLLSKGYAVCGTSRDAQMASYQNLVRLGIRDRVKVISMALNDFRSVLQALVQIQPDEVYNLAGQTSVGLSFDQPVETFDSVVLGTLNLLEAIRFTKRPIKLFNAASSECFGNTPNQPAIETTPFCPRSPYAVAKSAAFWQVANYREAYDLFACSGILFNHESPLRPQRFVTQKIIAAACRIAQGHSEKLMLGNIAIYRDWGWAPEYVEAMYAMLQQPQPEDYIIATGKSASLKALVAEAFAYFNLHWQDHVVLDTSLCRPTDLQFSCGNPTKARENFGWAARSTMVEVVHQMIEAQMDFVSSET